MRLVPVKRGSADHFGLDRAPVLDFRGGTAAEACLAPPGLVARSAGEAARSARELSRTAEAELLGVFSEAARLFETARLPAGAGGPGPDEPGPDEPGPDEPGPDELGPDGYVRLAALTTGLTVSCVRSAAHRLAGAMRGLARVLEAWSPDGTLAPYDSNLAARGGVRFGWVPRGGSLGVVAPGNSPGVSVHWLAACAAKVPVLLRPSMDDPFTPLRLIEALYRAGLPAGAVHLLPTSHEGAGALARCADLALVYGSRAPSWAAGPGVRFFGPGRSKLFIDEGCDEPGAVDAACRSIMEGCGRDCFSASAVVVAGGRARAERLGRALARRMAAAAAVDPLSEAAVVPAVKGAERARALDALVESSGGADLVREARGTPRLAEVDGARFVLPALVLTEPQDPLFGVELPFQFACIAGAGRDEARRLLGGSLVVSAYSDDPALARDLLLDPTIGKLYWNEPTCAIDPAEPHEGLLGEFLYAYKAARLPAEGG